MNKTKPQRIDPKQVKQFFADAQKRTSGTRKNLAIDAETAYQIAYEAMIKGSLALMLSHRQWPRKQLGHHIAIIEFAQKNLPGCPAGTFAMFDSQSTARRIPIMGKFDSQMLSTGPCTHVLAKVAVGTTIADRPPHRSARALTSACGSYLG